MARAIVGAVFLGAVTISLGMFLCPKEPITAWDSPRMLVLKDKWDRLLKTPSSTWGDKNDNLIENRDELLDNLSLEDMRHLAATCGALPVRQRDPNAFQVHVLQRIVVCFIKAGDRNSLVTLLSTRYPIYVGPEMTTTYFLVHFSRNRLKDPILIFGEAYFRCKVPEVRIHCERSSAHFPGFRRCGQRRCGVCQECHAMV